MECHGCCSLKTRFLTQRHGHTRTRFVDIPSYDIWHARLGHVSSGYIKKMQTLGLVNNIDYSGLSKFQICATSKQTKKTCG